MSETEEGEEFAEPVRAAPEPVKVDASLNKPFSIEGIKVIESTPGHQAPQAEDTIEGRYAQVLFTAASQKNNLYKVFEDMRFLSDLYTNSESFQIFSKNQAIGKKESDVFVGSLRQMGDFTDTTIKLIEVLIENRRFKFINHIATHYQKLYQTFNKEEKITIISAHELSSGEKSEVESALKQNPQNQGKEFVIEYQLDASILGGLQMYTESEFMDMSLQSRLDRLQGEVNRVSAGL